MKNDTQPNIGIVILTAVLAIILQLAVAPVITIFGIVPNFIMVAAIITAMRNGPTRSIITGFLLGLILDLFSLGPIGAMALVLTILSYGVSSLSKGAFTGGTIVDTIIMIVSVVAGEFLVSVVYAVMGANPDFLLSLVRVVLPAIAYDAIVGVLLILVYNAIAGGGMSSRPSAGNGRSLTRKLNM